MSNTFEGNPVTFSPAALAARARPAGVQVAAIGREVLDDLTPLQNAWAERADSAGLQYSPLKPRILTLHADRVTAIHRNGLPGKPGSRPTPDAILEALLDDPAIDREAALLGQEATYTALKRLRSDSRRVTDSFSTRVGVFVAASSNVYGETDLLAQEANVARASLLDIHAASPPIHVALRLGELFGRDGGRRNLRSRLRAFNESLEGVAIPSTFNLGRLAVLSL